MREIDTILERHYGPIQWKPRYDPISELVFTILSQHTSDANTSKAFSILCATFRSWREVAEADSKDIAQAIRIGGLSNVKAPRIKAVLQRIHQLRGRFNLEFLKDMPLEQAKTWLRQLPGVGPKTTAVVLCFALGMPAFPVDTHIYRIAKRLALIGPKISVDRAHDILEQAILPDRVFPFHMSLITHGRRICKAIRPRCEQCVLSFGCPSSLVLSGP
jgi:endonuclease-3